MPETGINYCDRTWNVVAGCDDASEGCRYCWARRTANRLAGHPSRAVREVYAGLTERWGREEALAWTGIVRTLPERLDQPLHWRTPQRVFVCSQADLFHPAVPRAFLADVFAVMAVARPVAGRHTWLLLTKRPVRMREVLSDGGFAAQVEAAAERLSHAGLEAWPLPNVHLGITAENQQRADERIPLLLRTPAAVRWVSLEPLLGGIDLWGARYPLPGGGLGSAFAWGKGVSWVVAGGESGGPPERRLVEPCPKLRWDTHARGRDPALACEHCHDTRWIPKTEALAWLLRLQRDCHAAGIPFYFKGFGGPRATSGGHLLGGRLWQQLPEVG